MIPRFADDTKEGVVALIPLAVGVGVGSLVSVTTLSWGNKFLLWQLAWWLLASVIIAIGSFFFDSMGWIESTALARWVSKAGLMWLAFFLSGLGISIYLVVSGRAASGLFVAYWPIPIAAWWLALSSSVHDADRQQHEAYIRATRAGFHDDVHRIEIAIVNIMDDREKKWEVTGDLQKIKQKIEFEGQFLRALYLAAAGGARQVPLRAVWTRWNIELSPEGPELRVLLSRLSEVAGRYPKEPSLLHDVHDHASWKDSQRFFYHLKSVKDMYLLNGDTDQFATCSYKHRSYLDDATEHALMVWRERRDVKVEKRPGEDISIVPWIELSLTARGVDLCRRSEDLDSIQQALLERERGYRVENQFNFKDSQASGIFGSHQNLVNTTFTHRSEVIDHIPLHELAQELCVLREVLLADPARHQESLEADRSINALSEAAEAAKNGDQRGVMRYLAQTGKWALDVATQIGSSLAVEAIKAALKI